MAWTGTACNSGSPGGPDEAVPTYGPCNLPPNYVGEVVLNRWPSFPLTYFFDAASFPAEFLEDYRSAITDGIRRWDEATARVVHSTGTPFLAGGEIQYNPTGMREGEDLVREGRISRQTFLRGVSGIAAHEMGHLLGIIGHPSQDVLMGLLSFHDTPTTADVNTLVHAYCR